MTLLWLIVQLAFYVVLLVGVVVAALAGILAPPVALGVFVYRRYFRAAH